MFMWVRRLGIELDISVMLACITWPTMISAMCSIGFGRYQVISIESEHELRLGKVSLMTWITLVDRWGG